MCRHGWASLQQKELGMSDTVSHDYNAQGKGVCCDNIAVSLEAGIIKSVEFSGGCYGNHQGIQRLVKGRPASEVISLLKGIPCQNNTSCPDQLALALQEALALQ
jgi:uncharacterized protein (TIGR03905 family)